MREKVRVQSAHHIKNVISKKQLIEDEKKKFIKFKFEKKEFYKECKEYL